MNDDDLRAELDRLIPFEGKITWMYLDNAEVPNVTTGIGYLISTVDAAIALPWQWIGSARPATAAEISADFFRAKNMPGGLRVDKYAGDLRLTPEAIEAEGLRRLRAMIAGLPGIFYTYDSYPAGPQQALLDLAWNVGLHALASWEHLRADCNADPPDWMGAAAQCHTANPDHNPNREHRNEWRSSCFVAAAAEVRP